MVTRASLTALALLVIAGCSGSLQGPPSFQQTYGAVDEPCSHSKVSVTHCTAHVYLVNHGGAGVALATIGVPVTDFAAAASSTRRTTTVRCGGYIPATSNGAEVDLACVIDLPAGKALAGAPILQAVNFTAATGSKSPEDRVIGGATLALAVVAGLTALIALVLAIAERRRAGESAAPSAGRAHQSHGRSPEQSHDDDSW